MSDASRARRLDEIFVDFSLSQQSSPVVDIVTFSYGEYVQTCEGINFEPFVQRAENRARVHYGLLTRRPGSKKDSFRAICREWWSVTNPNLVAVHVYFEA